VTPLPGLIYYLQDPVIVGIQFFTVRAHVQGIENWYHFSDIRTGQTPYIMNHPFLQNVSSIIFRKKGTWNTKPLLEQINEEQVIPVFKLCLSSRESNPIYKMRNTFWKFISRVLMGGRISLQSRNIIF
jgi:hypothetical protein